MTPLEALLELLARVGASQGAALVSEEEMSRWLAEAVRGLKSQKLLRKASPASSAICPGCEQECTMPVHTLPAGEHGSVSFIVWDKRDDVNRVAVTEERLKQWRCGVEDVGAFVARGVGLRPESLREIGRGLWELGMVAGKRRSQMLCLRANGKLELVAGNNALPLAELVRHEARSYAVYSAAIQRLVDIATTGDSRYTPSEARREARKLKTQALHERWRKAYRALKKSRPDMSDVWCSQQIAKGTVAENRNAETIRKHMKP